MKPFGFNEEEFTEVIYEYRSIPSGDVSWENEVCMSLFQFSLSYAIGHVTELVPVYMKA